MDCPLVFITIGDPAGIGPEVTVKAVSALSADDGLRLVVVGDQGVLDRAAAWLGVRVRWVAYQRSHGESLPAGTVEIVDLANVDLGWCKPGVPDARCGRAAYEYVEEAVNRCLRGEGSGIVTAPINKATLNAAGYRFAGHTEILASLCDVDSVAMLLVAPTLKAAHVSTHCSLAEAIRRVRPERIEEVALLTIETLAALGIKKPRLAVAGLNPHAGEGGLFGDEEEQYIRPAIESLRQRGFCVFGPEPPDTVFLRASRGEYDAVVAMYHDQGHIPVKILGFRQGVNVTLGLPIVRTSVDHGTAFDIAGTGEADAESMIMAIELAVTLAGARA